MNTPTPQTELAKRLVELEAAHILDGDTCSCGERILEGIDIFTDHRKYAAIITHTEESKAAERERCAVHVKKSCGSMVGMGQVLAEEIRALPPGDGALEDVRREAVKPWRIVAERLLLEESQRHCRYCMSLCHGDDEIIHGKGCILEIARALLQPKKEGE